MSASVRCSSQQQSLQNDLSRLEEEQKARQERLQDLIEERDRLQMELEDADAQVETARKKPGKAPGRARPHRAGTARYPPAAGPE